MHRLISIHLAIAFAAVVAQAETYTVSNTNDSGIGSLRWAIDQANDAPDPDSVAFAPNMLGKVIQPLSALPTLMGPMTVNGDIDSDGKPDVALNGRRQSSGWGLRLDDQCAVAGLAITRFPDGGIYMEDGDYNTIRSCHIGVNLPGTKAVRNQGPDIMLRTSYHNVIGGTSPTDRNIIAGGYRDESFPTFADAGVVLQICSDNQVIGNYFGLTRDGMTALEGGNVGLVVLGGGSNTVGGEATGARNVLGGLLYGMWLMQAQGNVIAGNLIGLAADGSKLMPVSFTGIEVQLGSVDNLIGGTVPAARNVFAGGSHQGIHFNGPGVENNKVKGNHFGLNAAGNRPRLLNTGVRLVNGAGAQTIGGGTVRAGNYFAQRTRASDWTYGVNIVVGSGQGSIIRRNRFGIRPDGRRSPITEGVRVSGAKLEISDNIFDGMIMVAITATGAGADPGVFRNRFHDCYAAVNVLDGARCRLGNLSNANTRDDGGNLFDPTNTRHIWNLTANRIRAEGNDFGAVSRAAIDAKILDKNDDPSLGKVDYTPRASAALATAGTPVLNLTGTAAVPAGAGGAEIVFSLSAPADVTASVVNIAGRPVATVARDATLQAGPQRLVWSGRTQQGTAAPSGTYLVRVTARSADGSQASALATCRVER